MTPRDPEATREKILDAAEEVFLAKGYGNAATSEIAEEAGVTKSLIHHHFGSKEGLWTEVKARRFRHYADAQLAMIREEGPTAELLRSSFEFYFRFLQQNPQLVRIMAWIFLEHEEETQPKAINDCMKLDEELFREGVERIRQAQEAGQFRTDVDPAFILFTFIGICQHWFQDRAHVREHVGEETPDEVLDERYLRDVTKIFFEGVLPR